MQQPNHPPIAAQTPAPAIPTILIEDQTSVPITTTRYICHHNELDFEAIYRKIKTLLSHNKCSHRSSKNAWPCVACEKIYLEKYWSSAAHLLDYFADFHQVDTPIMHVCWFHLIDIWQEAIDYFPCDFILENRSVSPEAMQAYTKARWLMKNFLDTLALLNTVIYGTKDKDTPREPIIHKPSGDYRTAGGEPYNTGPYNSGLRPWEQWLCKGGPGAPESSSPADDEVRYIPTAAIAIIKTHTERAERLAAEVNPDPDFLAAFKKNSLVFPQKPNTQTHTYTSHMGTTVSYHLENGAPPVMRPLEFGDHHVESTKLNFNLLDEYVGRSRGMEAYVPVSGNIGDDGEWEDGFVPFDVWAVTESKRGDDGDEKKEGSKGWQGRTDAWVVSDPS